MTSLDQNGPNSTNRPHSFPAEQTSLNPNGTTASNFTKGPSAKHKKHRRLNREQVSYLQIPLPPGGTLSMTLESHIVFSYIRNGCGMYFMPSWLNNQGYLCQ